MINTESTFTRPRNIENYLDRIRLKSKGTIKNIESYLRRFDNYLKETYTTNQTRQFLMKYCIWRIIKTLLFLISCKILWINWVAKQIIWTLTSSGIFIHLSAAEPSPWINKICFFFPFPDSRYLILSSSTFVQHSFNG